MLKIVLLAAMVLLPVSAMAGQRYCEEKPNPNYGTVIEEIPYGIAIITEESPQYCQLKKVDDNDTYTCYDGDPTFQFVVKRDQDDPHIFMDGQYFRPCDK